MNSSDSDQKDQNDTPFRAAIHLYISMTKGSRLLFAAALLLLMVSLLLYLAFAVAVGRLVDGVIGRETTTLALGGFMTDWGIDQWGLFLFTLVLVNMACSYFEICWFQKIGERATARLRTAMLDRLVYLPMSYFSQRRSGDLSSRMLADVSLLQEGWINDVRNTISYLAMILGSVSMLFLISPSLAMFVFLMGLPVIAVSVWIGKKIGRDAKQVQAQLGQTSVICEETIQGIQRVKTFANEEYEKKKFRDAASSCLGLAEKVARNRAALFSGILFILMSSSVFLLWYGSRQIQQEILSPGDFTSFMFFLGFLGNAGGMLAQLAGRIHRMSGAAQRANELLEEAVESSPSENPTQDASGKRLKGNIDFRRVSFAYPGRKEICVLNEIDLHLEAGKCTAVAGPSGAGKSTLAALLFRLYEPDQGELIIDGKNAKDYPLHHLRSQMAMVSQDLQLIGGTVRENIAYGKPSASQEEILEAARRANVMEFIDQLPLGLETLAGDRGVLFSAGQCQRIAIARAILRDPAILVLDEATSSLDAENERLVSEALEGLIEKRTTLVIAHRLSTVRRADMIIVMKEGRIVEQGNHEKLYAAGGFYRQLCEEQQWLVES